MVFKKKSVTEIQADVAKEAQQDPVSFKAKQEKATKAKVSSDKLTGEVLAGEAATLGVKINRSLAQLTEDIQKQLDIKGTLDEAIEAKEQEIQTLADKETLHLSLADLAHRHAIKEAEFQTLLDSQKTAAKEYDNSLVVTRDREQKEYEYTTNQSRRASTDKFNEEQSRQRKAAQEAQEAREKDWANREQALSDREDLLIALETQAAEFPARLEAVKAETAAEVSKSLHAGFSVQKQLLTKDAESDKRAYEQEITSLKATLSANVGQIQALRDELIAERTASKEIAIKAVESAAGREALSAVKEVQASTASGGSKAGAR